ncbi:MAG: AAA family ATPase [Acidimicrobiales bacterium]
MDYNSEKGGPVIYAFGEYELDMLTVELRRAGEVIHLEPQVFGVLAHLVDQRDRVVSKIELLDEVWPDRFVSESALTSRIQAARKACGDSGRDQNVIRTKHGRGYRFVAPVIEIDETALASPAEETVPAGGEATLDSSESRAEEQLALDESIAAVTTGQRGVIFVAGEAGMGKSTLVDSTVERVDPTLGIHFLQAQCRARRGPIEPYVALLDGLARFARLHGDEAVEIFERVAPMWALQLPSLFDASRTEHLRHRVIGGTAERMLREGVDLFGELAGLAPLVIVVEDLHWADRPTLEVIEWLAGNRDDTALVLIGTYRAGTDSTGELDAMVSTLTIGSARRLVLEPLDDAAVGRIIMDRLEATGVDDDLAEIAASRCDGNPLFVTEAVDAWCRGGLVAVEDGVARILGDADQLGRQVPESLRQLIERALDQLDPDELDLLQVAAVVGRDFPAFLVAAGTGSPVDSTESALGLLARRGRFVEAIGDESWPDGTVSTVFRLTHDLHRQVLHERIPAGRRASIHGAVGERLEVAAGHRVDEYAADLADHFLASGQTERGVAYLHRAGELAMARSAHLEALDWFERALTLMAELPASEQRHRTEIAIRTSRGPALIATSGWLPEEVEQNYVRALHLCDVMGPIPERFIVRYGLASVHELRGEYNRSEELLDEQMADGADLGVETQELLACSTFHQGSFERSLSYAEDGLTSWDQEEHSLLMARYGEHPGVSCNTWGALSAWFLGEVDLSIEMAERAIAWGATNEYALSTARVQFAFLRHFRRETEACRRWAEETATLADEQGFPFRSAQARVLLGWCEAMDGDPTAATAQIRAGLEVYRTFGARMDEPHFLGLLAEAELRAGRVADALGHLDESRTIIAATTRTFFFEPELDRLLAMALTARDADGDRDEASAALDRGVAVAQRNGSALQALRLECTRLDLALTAEPAVVRDEIGRLLTRIGPEADLPDVLAARSALGPPPRDHATDPSPPPHE